MRNITTKLTKLISDKTALLDELSLMFLEYENNFSHFIINNTHEEITETLYNEIHSIYKIYKSHFNTEESHYFNDPILKTQRELQNSLIDSVYEYKNIKNWNTIFNSLTQDNISKIYINVPDTDFYIDNKKHLNDLTKIKESSAVKKLLNSFNIANKHSSLDYGYEIFSTSDSLKIEKISMSEFVFENTEQFRLNNLKFFLNLKNSKRFEDLQLKSNFCMLNNTLENNNNIKKIKI